MISRSCLRSSTKAGELKRTAGMTREQAIAIPGMWAGLVRTEAHVSTGWHHHADYDTSIYVVSGWLRMESGPGGSQGVEAGPGDFLHVPKGAIHRAGNPFPQTRGLQPSRLGGVARRRLPVADAVPAGSGRPCSATPRPASIGYAAPSEVVSADDDTTVPSLLRFSVGPNCSEHRREVPEWHE